MTDIQLKRDHEGQITLFVAGVPARGSKFAGVNTNPEPGKSPYAIFTIPLDQVTFAEVDNVVPFVRPADRETR